MGKKYLITYTPRTANWNYSGMVAAIQSLGSWWHYLDHTWIIKNSLLTPQQMWAKIGSQISINDSLLIIEIVPSSKEGWLPRDAWDWINN